jgi:hypothetical protein
MEVLMAGNEKGDKPTEACIDNALKDYKSWKKEHGPENDSITARLTGETRNTSITSDEVAQIEQSCVANPRFKIDPKQGLKR